MEKIYSFNSNKIPRLSEVGGKAKALIETTNAGFPVPEGMVLTVEFFKPWMKEIKSSNEWNEVLNKVTKQSCDKLVELAQNLIFTKEQIKCVFEELKNIPSDIFAVRSSSPEEDLEGMSFAGMYETFLGVKESTLEKFIAKSFSSMFDFRVMEYKSQHNINIANNKIAIIIQKQLNSITSGVGFSINPNTNCYDEVIINSSFGLGEYIVSGKVSPDCYVVDIVKNEIISKKINEKKVALYLLKDGGTKEVICEDYNKESLTNKQIFELTNLIKKCEKYYDKPMDTEWAFENDKLYLLQSRPITTYLPLYEELKTNPGERKELYMDMIKTTQGFQHSMSELGGELFAELINTAKQGMMPVGKEGIVYCCHGRIYLLIGNAAKVMGEEKIVKSIGMMEPTISQMLKSMDLKEYIPDKKPELTKGMIGDIFKLIIRMTPQAIKSSKNIDKAVKEYFEATDKYMSTLDKLQGSKDLFTNQVETAMNIYLEFASKAAAMIPAVIAETTLKKMFKGHNVDNDILALSMNLKGNPTAQMGDMQLHIASQNEFIECRCYDEFRKKLYNKEFSSGFINYYNDYMKKFGCRGIGEIDIVNKRTHEDIEGFYNILKSININDNALENIKDRKDKAYNKLLEISKEIKKEKKFIKVAKNLEWMGLREHPKYVYVYSVSILRHNLLKIAQDFVMNNQLLNVEDVFYLTKHEIVKGQKDKEFDLKPLVAKEKKIRKLTENQKSWPSLIDSRGKILRSKRDVKEGELAGEPVAPGVIRGRAKVLHSPFEKKLEKGEILVTMATEPSWTPIFINALAVVMEVGGALQHGAIIAREYGLPCVTGIDNATELIKDGDIIEVDGNNGLVKIIK